MYIYILLDILFHYGLSQDIEYSSLCCSRTLLFIHSLYIIVCFCWCQTPNPSLPHLPVGNHKSSLSQQWYMFKIKYNLHQDAHSILRTQASEFGEMYNHSPSRERKGFHHCCISGHQHWFSTLQGPHLALIGWEYHLLNSLCSYETNPSHC